MDDGYDAIVLAGGAAQRFGSDKAMALLAGRPLLAHVLDAVTPARELVVVGEPRTGFDQLRWTREDPPGAGPRAGFAAGLALLGARPVLLLAADQPWVAPAVPALLAALPGHDVAVVVQADARRNPLVSAWRPEAASVALARPGRSLVGLFAGLDIAEVADPAGWCDDVDTAADLDAARRRVSDRSGHRAGCREGPRQKEQR